MSKSKVSCQRRKHIFIYYVNRRSTYAIIRVLRRKSNCVPQTPQLEAEPTRHRVAACAAPHVTVDPRTPQYVHPYDHRSRPFPHTSTLRPPKPNRTYLCLAPPAQSQRKHRTSYDSMPWCRAHKFPATGSASPHGHSNKARSLSLRNELPEFVGSSSKRLVRSARSRHIPKVPRKW